tara:strand:+ start:839 stop:1006 length:168 start_codon:yes stop_codon:yes gene_type:complete
MAWNELLATLKENREFLQQDEEQRVVACPVCGHAPLDERDGILNCPIGDYRSDKV